VLLLGRQHHSRRWHQQFSAGDVLGASAAVLRPGGFLVAVTKSAELEGTSRDLGLETVRLCRALGLEYWQHVVALLVPIRGGRLRPRRPRRRGGQPGPATQIGHADVLVFRKPPAWPLDRQASAREAA